MSGGYTVGLTVNEALSIEAMRQTKVVAGETGLDREILWVTVIEVLDEIHLLQEGELLITTAFGLADIPSLLDELIPQLVQRKLAGLAIQTGYYLDVIPLTIIQQCNHYGFPLLELPKQIKFSELTMAITKRIINRQTEMLEYAQKIHARLTQVLLQNKGLPQIAIVLTELLSAPVRILDAHFNILTASGLEESSSWINPEAVQAEYQLLKQRSLLSTGITPIPIRAKKVNGCPDQFLQPLIVGKEVYGFLSVLTSKPALEDMEQIAISSAATISTLEILKEKAVWETEERVKGDFIDDLLENNIQTDTVLRRRANYLGFNLDKNFAIMAFQFDNLNTSMPNYSESRFQETKQRLFSLARFVLQSYQKQALLKYKSNKLIILLQVDNDPANTLAKQELSHTAELLGKTIAAETGVTTSIGIGRSYRQLSEMMKSFQEAERALAIGQRLLNNECILFYEDLGPYILFADTGNEAELLNYYNHTVSALIDYDASHKSELISTLEAFIKCNNGLKETAKDLFVHRHTLKYRLRRIQEIAKLDPENALDQFQLQLGLIAARLLSKL
jgi:purine catabolism regulator